ncbi:hypothetical protein HO133_008420 [Letharia lupina]|uniref:Uncharacterized protein n=1 Tax=Letharia lupina TaxID=560253 RepID=A0A8H6CNV8_9LECA|nr:uncharacterized protein HO133_008420 [Letharia lupina]KAF6226979.1 hypothetical protein HO133_008420 [Letharia lupina]
MNQVLHPQLDLQKTMVHIPDIKAGGAVVWLCDTIHAVDKVHMGKSDSSVMYIPICPSLKETRSIFVASETPCCKGCQVQTSLATMESLSTLADRPTCT